jgi:hypothetical protein
MAWTMINLQKLAAKVIVVVCGLAILILPFLNSELTQAELLQEYWQYYFLLTCFLIFSVQMMIRLEAPDER